MSEGYFQPPPDAEWIQAVRDAVREEIYNHSCRLTQISDAEIKDLGHALGMITDLGQGDTRAGVEVIRANVNWMVKQRERTEQFGRTFFFAVITSVVGGVLLAVVLGVKALIGMK